MKLTVILNADASGLIGTVRVSEAELRKLGGSLDRTGGSSDKASAGLKRTSAAADGMGASTNRLVSRINTLNGMLATLGLTYVATQTLQAGLAMDRYRVSLAAATGSIAQGAQEMAYLRAEAERLGLYLPALAQGYSGLAAATRGTNLEGEQTRKIFSAVAEAGRSMNLTTDQLLGTLTALQQMAGKGFVSMEELRQQLGDRLPGAIQIAARAMNMSVAELVKMVSTGSLLSDEFLPKFAAELSKASAAGVAFAQNSPAAEFARLKTELFELGAAVAGGGVLDSISSGARELTDALKNINDSGVIPDIVDGIELIATVAVLAFGGRSIQAITGFVGRLRDSVVAQKEWAAAARESAVLAESSALAVQRRAAVEAQQAQALLATASAEHQSTVATRAAQMATLQAVQADVAKAESNLALARTGLVRVRAEAQVNAALGAQTVARLQALAAMDDEVRAASRLEAAKAAQIRANVALTESNIALRAATQGVAAANQQAAAAASLNMVAGQKLMAMGKSLFAMIGGWPTVLLAVGYAAYQMWDAVTNGSDEAQAAIGRASQRFAHAEEAIRTMRNELNGIPASTAQAAVGFQELDEQIHQHQRQLELARLTGEEFSAWWPAQLGLWALSKYETDKATKSLELLNEQRAQEMRLMLDRAAMTDRLQQSRGNESNALREQVDTYLALGVSYAEITEKLRAAGLMQEYVNQIFGRTPATAKAAADAVRGFSEETEKFLDATYERISTMGLDAEQMIRWRAAQAAMTAETDAARVAINKAADAEIQALRAHNATTKAREESARATESATRAAADYIDRLKEEIATMGMGAEQLARHEMAKLKLTDAQKIEAEQLLQLRAAWQELAAAMEPAYDALEEILKGSADLEEQLAQGRDVLAGLDDAQIRYNASLREANRLAMEALALGPMTEEQQAQLEQRLRLLAELRDQDRAIEQMQELGREATRAAEESTRAWEDFTGGLADAVLDGSQGVKRWWKRMLDDMKRQLIQSGLLKLFGSLFNTGGASASSGFGQMFSSMFGGGAMRAAGGPGLGIGSIFQLAGAVGGGSGGNLLTSLAGAISGGISGGLISIGGTLAGGGGLLGGLGMGLMQTGGFINTHGLLGGLWKGLTDGLSTMFGGGGFMDGLGKMIPGIAAIAGVAAAIQKISGGKLFGTSYSFDSAGRTLDFSATGASGQDRVTEVRQRSLFRGRRWRDTFSGLPDDVADAIGEFWDGVIASNVAIAGDAARTIDAQIRQEFDAEGNVTKTIVEVLGRTWEESLEEAMTRIAAENMIANIDAMLGTTVQRAITGPGTGVGPGTGPGFVGPDIKDPGFHDTIIKATQTVGEAFAIAERWRHDAELLAEGAQFLLAAASDIQRGAGLLGDEGGLTAITDLIEDLSRPGESLVDTYVRVATSTALLDQALALSGVQIEGTREHIVRLATDITTAAGGLERASALWGNYFDRFYTGIERGEYVLAQAQASAAKEFGDIGLDYTQFTGEGGTQAFRELFEAVLPTLSAEAIVEWLEAAAALGIVIDATAALNAELGEAAIAVSQTSEQLAAVNDILAGNAWELALAGMTNAEAAIARINQKYDEQRKELLANAATLEQLAELEGQRQQALAQQAEAAQRQIDDILGGLQRDIDSLGMSEYEREVANIHKQRADYIAALVETGMSLADATIATRAWRDAMLEAAEAAEAARQQRLLDRRSDILGGLQTDIDRLGMTDYEIAVADVHAKRQDHIAALVDTGMSLADATIATREWRDAMLESVRAAEQARILKPLADDLKSMRQQLADFGLSDFARRQAQIARETQDALAAAQAAGATAAELMTISLNGAERAMLAAALAAKGFAAQLEGWEFEESLIGLSESEAQLARINKTWEERYLQAVEIFGEGSEEAIRVLGLWDRAVARAADVSTRAMNAINVSGRSIAETMELVQTFYDNLMSKLGHVIGGDPMADWLSELSGLPKLAQQAVRRPLSEVVQLVRNEYLLRAADLNRQIEAAQHQLSILPWDAQAQRRELEHRIGTLHYALGAISDGMGNALDTLKDMYIASLQGVRDYLDSMLLGDLSALTPAERIAEAWDQLTAAVEAGEGDAATRLADTYLRLLREFEASGDDYNTGFYAVRDLLESMFDVDWDALLGPDAATDSDNLAHMASTVDAQLAAAQVANDWLAQIAANTGGGWGMPSYDVGTYNVPQTGPAILHAGEMVLPRPMADAMRQGNFGGGGDTRALETRLDAVIARLDRLDKTTAQGAQAVSQTIVTTGATSDRNADASRARHAQAQRRGVTA